MAQCSSTIDWSRRKRNCFIDAEADRLLRPSLMITSMIISRPEALHVAQNPSSSLYCISTMHKSPLDVRASTRRKVRWYALVSATCRASSILGAGSAGVRCAMTVCSLEKRVLSNNKPHSSYQHPSEPSYCATGVMICGRRKRQV